APSTPTARTVPVSGSPPLTCPWFGIIHSTCWLNIPDPELSRIPAIPGYPERSTDGYIRPGSRGDHPPGILRRHFPGHGRVGGAGSEAHADAVTPRALDQQPGARGAEHRGRSPDLPGG